jgi:hypothetical protein
VTDTKGAPRGALVYAVYRTHDAVVDSIAADEAQPQEVQMKPDADTQDAPTAAVQATVQVAAKQKSKRTRKAATKRTRKVAAVHAELRPGTKNENFTTRCAARAE